MFEHHTSALTLLHEEKVARVLHRVDEIGHALKQVKNLLTETEDRLFDLRDEVDDIS